MVETWPSSIYYEDFGPANISYAVAYPWTTGGKSGPWYRDNNDATCPYLSDMPPAEGDVFGGVTVAVEKAGVPGNAGPHSYNSPNHNGAGQNVAYGDVHVEWRDTPVCGARGPAGLDNIFTVSMTDPAGPDPVGKPPLGGALPAPIRTDRAPFDVVMVPARASNGALR